MQLYADVSGNSLNMSNSNNSALKIFQQATLSTITTLSMLLQNCKLPHNFHLADL
jgi:hypothetical protein